MRNKYTAEQREKLVRSGARVTEVAKRIGVAPSAAYAWLKAAGATAAWTAPVFARVLPAQPAGRIELEIVGVKVRVEPDFDAVLLRQVVAALSAAS